MSGGQQRGYRRESYGEHIQKMLDVYQARLYREIAYPAARLEQKMNLPAGWLERAIRLAIALHDVGKMDRCWQSWAHEWQERIGAPVAEDYMLAHTDYNPDDRRHQTVGAGMRGFRPPHAAEGAVAVFRIVHRLLGAPRQDDPGLKLMKAVFAAIARHRSPRADSYKRFELHPAAETTLAQVLADLGFGGQAHTAVVMRKDPQPVAALSEFTQSYNAENARVYEKTGEQYRKNILTTDMEDIVRLVDRYGATTVGNLLIAFGYAREPREEEEQK